MKCAPFDYLRASSVEEVVKTLDATEDAKILAGGQSLVPVLALRMARPTLIVDVNRIPGLSGLRPDPDGTGRGPDHGSADPRTAAPATILDTAADQGSDSDPGPTTSAPAVRIGALTRHQSLVEQTEHPLLAEAARWIGHTAIRTRGTIGGSLSHADPSAELPVVATATGATVTVAGPGGERDVGIDELFLGAMMTTLEENEMIVSVRMPLPQRWGFAEFARRHGDFALVTAVAAEFDGRMRLVLGGVGGVPVRAREAEAVLADGGSATEAARAASAEIEPTADLHGSVAFRRAIATEMSRRALRQAGIH